jgi:hypothetical protein
VNHHLDGVADLQEFWIDCEREFAEGEDAFGFSADVDEDFVFISLDDGPREDLALVEDLERLFVQPLFECELIFFLTDGCEFGC